MNQHIENYWNETTVLLYGLLGGYTQLNREEVIKAVNQVTNVEGNVERSIDVLAALEGLQKIRVQGVWLDFKEYSIRLQDDESEEGQKLHEKVKDIAVWEIDSKEVLRSDFTQLLEWREIISEALHGCIDFDFVILDQGWIKNAMRSYLEHYRHNELFLPDVPVSSYRQQYVAVTNLLETTAPKVVHKFLLPDNVRLLESFFSLVDAAKITISSFDDLTKPITDPMFGIRVHSTKTKKLRTADTRIIKLGQTSYDPASGILNILGEPVEIVSQKKRLSKENEGNSAKLMRLLFYVNTFPRPVAIRQIYPVKTDDYPASVKKKARSLVTEINEKVQEKYPGAELITCDGYKFEVDERHLKN